MSAAKANNNKDTYKATAIWLRAVENVPDLQHLAFFYIRFVVGDE